MFGLSYLKIGAMVAVALAIAGLFAWAQMERAGRFAEVAKNADLQATNNELLAVHDNDVRAIAELRDAAAKAAQAALADQTQQRVIVQTVTKWKERLVNAPPTLEACRAASPHDVAVLASVSAIIAAADTDPSAANPAAPGVDGGHPAPGSAGNDNHAGSVGRGDAGPGGVGSGAAGASSQSPDLGARIREAVGL